MRKTPVNYITDQNYIDISKGKNTTFAHEGSFHLYCPISTFLPSPLTFSWLCFKPQAFMHLSSSSRENTTCHTTPSHCAFYACEFFLFVCLFLPTTTQRIQAFKMISCALCQNVRIYIKPNLYNR